MRLKRGNVEREVEDEFHVAKFVKDGYKPMEKITDSKETEKKDVQEMSLEELRQLAKAKGLKGTSSLAKQELLENKYKCNIMNLVDDMPALSTMLTIIQAAMLEWEHGIKYERIKQLYDQYTDEGGNQMSLYRDIVLPTLAVSGFFTEDATAQILERLECKQHGWSQQHERVEREYLCPDCLPKSIMVYA